MPLVLFNSDSRVSDYLLSCSKCMQLPVCNGPLGSRFAPDPFKTRSRTRTRRQMWQKRFLTFPSVLEQQQHKFLFQKQLQGCLRAAKENWELQLKNASLKKLLRKPYNLVYSHVQSSFSHSGCYGPVDIYIHLICSLCF